MKTKVNRRQRWVSLRKYGLVIGIPFVTFVAPLIYLTGLDFVFVFNQARTPEQRVESFIRKSEICDKRWNLIDRLAITDVVDWLEWGNYFREWLVLKTSGVNEFTLFEVADYPSDFDFYFEVHEVAGESIIHVDKKGAKTIVETQAKSGYYKYFTYHLEKVRGRWALRKVYGFSTPRDKKLYTQAEQNALLDISSQPLKFGPDRVEHDFGRWFETGRDFVVDGRTFSVTSIADGELHLSRGVVGIQYLDTDRNFLPFEHRLEPGRYKLERSFIQNHCFAIRLLVDEDRPATKYVPALRRLPLKGSATNPRNVISESGCHSISPVLFDASTFLGSDSRDVEKLKINFSRTLEANRDWLSTHYHSGAKSLVKVPSYPKYSVGAPIGEYDVVSMFEYCDAIHCYWGVTDDGEVASLVAVFGLVIEPVYETLEIDWDISMLGQPLSHPTLKKMGLNIVLDQPDRPQVRFSGQLPYVGGIRKFKLEDTSGIVFEPDLRMHRDSIQLPVKQYLRTGKKRLGDYQSLKIRMEISTGHKFKF